VDDLAFLREPERVRIAAASADEPRRRPGRRRSRRVAGAAVAIAVAVAAAAAVGAGAVSARGGASQDAASVRISRGATAPPSPAPVRPIARSPVPPPAGAPFPAPGPGRGLLHHTGGPYVSRAQVVRHVLRDLECSVGSQRRNAPGVVCARVDVAFFARYADAWKLRGAIWAFVDPWAADREMYVVTVWGALPVAGVPYRAGDPAPVELTTVLVDATTGAEMMQGGPPLPAPYADG
jgi:hypothetical protein